MGGMWDMGIGDWGLAYGSGSFGVLFRVFFLFCVLSVFSEARLG